jgi:hypothetical protein
MWSTADWTNELTSSCGSGRRADPKVPPSSVHGRRTPCLEGKPEALRPAPRAAGFSYDTSGGAAGLRPHKDQWQARPPVYTVS